MQTLAQPAMRAATPSTHLRVGDHELAYARIGHGPDLVFVHGWPLHSGTFRNLVPEFQKDYTCHLLDLPCAGKSRSAPAAAVSFKNQIAVLRGAIDVSPEEKGIGIQLPLNSGVNINLHHFNNTDAPLLRENWVNAWYMPKAEVTRKAQGILIAAAVNYPIGMQLDSEGSAAASSETQVLSLWGHRHAWTTRLHAWVVRKDGSEELVYDSNDWYDMPTFSYNSVAKNPEPGKAGIDGASTGPLVLHPGDEMHFNCHVDTTKARADEIGVPLPTAPITWANEATTAEMCLLEGQTTGGSLFGGVENINLD